MDRGGLLLHQYGCFCADIAASLDNDAKMQRVKTFHNWNKDWQQPLRCVGPRGDPILKEDLRRNVGDQADIQ
jgi:hypothetical protein